MIKDIREKIKQESQDFCLAIEQKDINKVENYLRAGINVHYGSNKALSIASRLGHIDVLKKFKEYGIDLASQSNIALKSAAEYGQLDTIKYLVQTGINADSFYQRGITALEYAATSNSLETLTYLLENFASDTEVRAFCLESAANNNNIEMAKLLLKKVKKDDIFVALKAAFVNNKEEIFNYLLGYYNPNQEELESMVSLSYSVNNKSMLTKILSYDNSIRSFNLSLLNKLSETLNVQLNKILFFKSDKIEQLTEVETVTLIEKMLKKNCVETLQELEKKGYDLEVPELELLTNSFIYVCEDGEKTALDYLLSKTKNLQRNKRFVNKNIIKVLAVNNHVEMLKHMYNLGYNVSIAEREGTEDVINWVKKINLKENLDHGLDVKRHFPKSKL